MSNSQSSERATFSSRRAFMFAAIGSAVGLGNIWRFPYIAFDNGGGAFVLPYLVALLTAGIPLLLLDYAIGHRYRGSPPLAFRRLGRLFEPMGWWNFLTNVIICIYYAVIVGWAASYAYYSLTSAWGADPQAFFFKDFLQMADAKDLGLDFVGKVAGPLIAVWVFTLAIMALGVQKGVAGASTFFMPLLVVMFVIMVGIALTLPISSAAICAALGLTGLAGGAALAGCCAQMVGFAIISFRDNGIGGLVAQGIGTSMLQISNIIKNPYILVPPTLAGAITGPLSTVVFKMTNSPLGAGMGTSGLVGQIGTFTTMGGNAHTIAGVAILHFVLPAVLALIFDRVLRKMGKIKDGDYKLNI